MKKFLKWFGIIFVILLLLLIALPFIFKGKIIIDDAIVNCLVNAEGKANWDIAKPSTGPATASEPSAFKANLNYYAIKNSRIVYDDKTLPFRLVLEEMNHEGSGDFTQDLFT